METLQPTNQNDMAAINNNDKVSKNEHQTNEEIQAQIKIHHEHLKNITKFDKYIKET